LIVVDASVLANVIADDGPDGQLARREVRNAGDISAPDLVDVETLAVLRKRWLAGTISDRRFVAALDDLDALELGRYPTLPLVPRGYDLRANVSAYDAMYVALAEAELPVADSRPASGWRARPSVRHPVAAVI
jgi:predicted nucleic acid-binding protein